MRSDWRSARRPAVVEGTKNIRLIGRLGAFSPGLKPSHPKMERSRGFENPRPRTKSPGLHVLTERCTCGLVQRCVAENPGFGTCRQLP
jgi:hypothetical protein